MKKTALWVVKDFFIGIAICVLPIIAAVVVSNIEVLRSLSPVKLYYENSDGEYYKLMSCWVYGFLNICLWYLIFCVFVIVKNAAFGKK